jgi:6-phosphogluconolactonase
MIEELSGTVQAFKFINGKPVAVQRLATRKKPDSVSAGSADIHVSPDGRFLYASNRGDVNDIAIYSIDQKNGLLKLAGSQSSLGRSPRNFSIDPGGNYLLCANQNTDEIVVLSINKNTGMLKDTGERIKVGKPVCLKWVRP